ncbi:Hypothetical_protein [Hexamita inflata]|uniref:Hypothetical_protein n=1 Tax=Hexamita inflata TaxID=28002 RepID=A0AA86QI04_9EUKA|nr:Hypothetical protein HINF_LOCUS44262 [Hexamita inflata]
MTLFHGLNLDQIINNANTITRNSPAQPKAVINKKTPLYGFFLRREFYLLHGVSIAFMLYAIGLDFYDFANMFHAVKKYCKGDQRQFYHLAINTLYLVREECCRFLSDHWFRKEM